MLHFDIFQANMPWVTTWWPGNARAKVATFGNRSSEILLYQDECEHAEAAEKVQIGSTSVAICDPPGDPPGYTPGDSQMNRSQLLPEALRRYTAMCLARRCHLLFGSSPKRPNDLMVSQCFLHNAWWCLIYYYCVYIYIYSVCLDQLRAIADHDTYSLKEVIFLPCPRCNAYLRRHGFCESELLADLPGLHHFPTIDAGW